VTYEDLLTFWPLILVIEDCYIPSSADALINGLSGLDDESCALTIELWAMDAEIENCQN
jgi:hypothetical protein